VKHLELIELIYKHRHLIDDAFKGEVVQDLPSALIEEAGLFQKVSKRYELSDSYVQFANAILKRVDANYTFGDYNEEIKLLLKQKSDYLETQDKNILTRMKELVGTLYKKIQQRDILINARINDIVNDNDLSIELIIKDALDVDNRISELIEAHAENLKILGKDLRGLDDELDSILVDIGLDMVVFTENIHSYNNRLSDFILRTQKRKEQNKKLASLANKITKEQDQDLVSMLLSNPQIYQHTFKERKTGNIKHLPNPIELKKASFIDALSKQLRIKKVKRKAQHDKPYGISENLDMKSVRLQIIQKDVLKDKPSDIYHYILEHPEIKKFAEDDIYSSFAFKTYLTIVQNYRENIVLDTQFNNNNIRIAKWI